MESSLFKSLIVILILFMMFLLTLGLVRVTINNADKTRMVTEGESVHSYAETISLDALELNVSEDLKIQKALVIADENAVRNHIISSITDRYSNRNDIVINSSDITNMTVFPGTYSVVGSGRDAKVIQLDSERPYVIFDLRVNFTSIIKDSGPGSRTYKVEAKLTHIPQKN